MSRSCATFSPCFGEVRGVALHQLRLADRRARLARGERLGPRLSSPSTPSPAATAPLETIDALVPRLHRRRDLRAEPANLPVVERSPARIGEDAGAEFEDDASRGGHGGAEDRHADFRRNAQHPASKNPFPPPRACVIRRGSFPGPPGITWKKPSPRKSSKWSANTSSSNSAKTIADGFLAYHRGSGWAAQYRDHSLEHGASTSSTPRWTPAQSSRSPITPGARRRRNRRRSTAAGAHARRLVLLPPVYFQPPTHGTKQPTTHGQIHEIPKVCLYLGQQ